MSNIFTVTDRRGIKIFCTQEQWNNHILCGHTMMRNNLPAIIETLKAPDYIYESHDSEPPLDYREILVKETPSATYFPNIPYTKVIVSMGGGWGEVITAFPAKNPKGGAKGEAIYSADDEN